MSTVRHYSNKPMRTKFAAVAPMGDYALMRLQSATGDDGRLHANTINAPKDQVSHAFDSNNLNVMRDGFNESNQLSVGSNQSKVAVSVRDMKKYSPVPIKEHEMADLTGGGFYHAKDNFIGTTKNPDVNTLAHEIGHAQFQDSLLGKITQNPISRLLHAAAPLGGVATGYYSKGTPNKRALKALLVGLGMSAPTLASEGVASYKGHKALQELGASKDELSAYKKDLLLPQMSYLMNPLVSAIGGYSSSRLKRASARKLVRRMKFRDLDVSIETDRGDYRHWYDTHARKAGKTLMKYPYGYIRGTQGMDGDHIDCFIGPNQDATHVYVITTNKAPDFNRVDEQKCMLGFNSESAAKAAFHEHYTNTKFFNSMRTLTYKEFKDKALSTLNGGLKKIASIATFEELREWNRLNPGPQHDQVPGDYLGFPASSLVGLRKVEGAPLDPSDTIDRQFKFNDLQTNSRVLEGNTAAHPSGPGA